MKKYFSLRYKILLFTSILSLLIVSLAMGVTFSINYVHGKNTKYGYFEDAMQESLTVTNKENEYQDREYIPMLSYYITKIFSVYDKHKDKLDTYDEKQMAEYFKEINNAVTQQLFGGDFLAKKSAYYLLLSTISRAYECTSIGVGFFDKEYSRIIMLGDSASGDNIAGTFYQGFSESELAFYNGGYESNNKMIAENELDLTGTNGVSIEALPSLFIRTNTSLPTIWDTLAKSNFLTYFFVMLGSIILLAIIYLIVSHFVIISKLKKLETSTNIFVESLDKNEDLKIVSADVKSHDELGALAMQFETMQGSIIKYVDETKENAVKEGFMNSELNIARNIQLNSLPESQYFINNFEINAFINPAKEVGGDFYDYFQIDNDHIAFVVADVSGKGVPASLFMMRAKTLIKSSLMSNKSLKEAIITINNELLYRNDLMLFITVFIGILDTSNNKLTYINCGHEHPYIIEKDGSNTLFECESNIPLGLDRYDFVVEHLTLKENQSLLLYTDGLSEAINQKTEQFGLKRISASIKNHYFETNLIKGVFDDMNKFADGQDQFDDVTIMFIRHAENKLHLEYRNPDINVITELIDKTEEFLTKNHKSSQAGVIIDELVNNMINYGFKDNKKALLSFDCYFENDDVVLVFKDNGVKFNPLEVEERQLDENVIGGVGISLMRSLSKKQDYQRVDDMNILTIVL